jgi:hypothetical protein
MGLRLDDDGHEVGVRESVASESLDRECLEVWNVIDQGTLSRLPGGCRASSIMELADRDLRRFRHGICETLLVYSYDG